METSIRKPSWLNKKISLSVGYRVKRVLKDLRLHSVCQESLCPNISECFNAGTAAFMILGKACTRNCSFCGIIKGQPDAVDYEEPRRIKEAVKRLGLSYIVITSPARDDLCDGGADLFCETVKVIKNLGSSKKVEILIPDFLGKKRSIEKAANSSADIIAHNVETVSSHYIKVRPKANYRRSLEVLRIIKSINKEVLTKSGLMLGLGEKDLEVEETLQDLKMAGCDFLTIGQYLPPSLKHYILKEYVNPDKFSYFKEYALKLGFRRVEAAPYVRSSYRAHLFMHNM